MSSMCFAVCANSSLTSRPHWPRFSNLNGDGNAAPVLRSVLRLPVGSVLPAYFASAGLESKVSTWLGPPLANRWMTCLALAGKCGCFGASGLTAAYRVRGQQPRFSQKLRQTEHTHADTAPGEHLAA